jgi:hypothetical protein
VKHEGKVKACEGIWLQQPDDNTKRDVIDTMDEIISTAYDVSIVDDVTVIYDVIVVFISTMSIKVRKYVKRIFRSCS